MIGSRTAFALVVSAALMAGAVTAEAGKYYKWVDEKGVTHYGEKAPDGAKATALKVGDTTSSDADDEIKKLSEKRSAAEEARKKAEGDKKAPDVGSKEDKERMKTLCDQHRKNLESLNSGKRVLTKDEKGVGRYLSDDEMAEQRKYAEGEVQRCQQYDKVKPAAAAQ